MAALSGATLEKAVRELNEPEDPSKKQEVIRELREKLEEWQKTESAEQGFSLSRLDDDKFLVRFLRCKKFEVDRAKQLFINYHKYRHKHAAMLGEITPQAAAHILSSGMLCVLPQRCRSGCRVLVARLSEWDLDTLTPGELMRTMLVLMDKLLEEEETQVNGICIIEDMEGMSFMQVIKLAQMEQMRDGLAIELIQVGLMAYLS